MKTTTNTTTPTTKETLRLIAEIAKTMKRYQLTEEAMQTIIDQHDGNVKAALRTIEMTGEMIKKMA